MNIKCQFWSESAEFFRGRCDAGKYNGRPTFGQCVDLCLKCDRSELESYMAILPRQKVKPRQELPTGTPAQIEAARQICDNCPEHKIRGCCGGEVRACPYGMPFDILNGGWLPPCDKLKEL